MRAKTIISLLTAITLAVVAGCAGTQQAAAPQAEAGGTPDWFFHDIVGAAFVAQYVQIPMPEDVMIIDARPKRTKYDKGHIPMAVSIPDSQFEKLTDLLPEKKDVLLIYYCEGPACKLSHKSARKAESLGYTNVKVYADGFPGWMKIAGHYAAVSENWVKNQLDKQADITLVDSRPKRTKYDKGHIPTAISIPDSQFDKLTAQLPRDKEKALVFYCGGLKCKLSHKSAEKAIAAGYTNVKVFAAGYPAYTALMADTGETAGVVAATSMKSGADEGTIDNQEFVNLVKNQPDSLYLVDVRDPDEYAKGSFKTAVNIPVDQLESKIKTLPTDKPVVFVCGTGARSGESYYMVQDLRPELKNVFYVEAELAFKKDGSFDLTELKN
ncbi:MAG: rhodanese-like domain-containing protein [Desulfobacteraceae bacterium]|nr:rhodanese-like domain-containing protein [Desulfobacteraceae bacterium]